AEPRGLNCGPKLPPLRDRPRPADHTTDVFADRETESERRGLSRTSTPATPRYAQPISHRKVANAPDSLKSKKRRPKRAPAFHPPRELLGALPRRCPRRCLPSVPLGRSVLVDVGLRRRRRLAVARLRRGGGAAGIRGACIGLRWALDVLRLLGGRALVVSGRWRFRLGESRCSYHYGVHDS